MVAVEDWYLTHWDEFNYPGKKFPLAIGVFHDLQLKPGVRPFSDKPRKLSPTQMSEFKKQLDEMLKNDVVEPSVSEW